MSNPLFNRFGNTPQYNHRPANSPSNNIISQFLRLKNNPGEILDILLNNGKISQQQYNELQPYKNNPEMIGKYLISHGNSDAINHAEQIANMGKNNLR